MTSTSTVAIWGAGAMGGAYASRFYELDPSRVALVASGERYQRLKRDGLIINDTRYPFRVLAPDDTAAPSDLIIIALKHRYLVESLPELRNRVGDNTVILSVMNGLDSEAILSAVYGDKVLFTTAVGIDTLRNGNRITFRKIGMLFFGEADNTVLTERVIRVQRLLEQAGIPYETPVDMIRALWWKLMVNVGINQTSALLRAPYGVFQTSVHARAIMEAAMREVVTIARAAKVNLVEADINDWYPVLNTLHPQGRTSMLQDVEAGRETEVDIFAGKVVELGQQYGIPTPVNDLLLHAIKVIETQRIRPESA